MPVFRNGKVLYLTPKNHAHLRSTDELRSVPAFRFEDILSNVDRRLAAIQQHAPMTDLPVEDDEQHVSR